MSAPTVMETVRGLHLRAGDDARTTRTLAWFTRLTAHDLIDVLSLDRHAAAVAGRLRALHPLPPTGIRRKATKPEQRAAWVMDIQIAACAWTHGRRLATHNVRDFECLSELIAGLYPASSPLEIVAHEAS